MSTRTTLTSGWEPTAATPRLLPVAPGLAKTYMKLFVNRLSYCEQSPYGDHRYHRPKHPELKTLAGRRAAMEMPGQKWGSLPHTDRTNEIYLELVRERRLPSPYRSLTEKTIEQHLAGQVTVNLYAINPETQCCKWVAIDADYETEQAKRDLAKLRKELLLENVYAVQEYSRRGGHLWIFCEDPLPARQCRLFVYNLALRLGVPIKGSGFSDEGIEIFPKQDSLAPGALGNGIRAPLGIHRKNDNRYWFVDIGQLTLQAQIEALCQLPKLTAEQLNDLTHKMPPPPQWETADDPPPASTRAIFQRKRQWSEEAFRHLRTRILGDTSVQLAARTILCSARPVALLVTTQAKITLASANPTVPDTATTTVMRAAQRMTFEMPSGTRVLRTSRNIRRCPNGGWFLSFRFTTGKAHDCSRLCLASQPF